MERYEHETGSFEELCAASASSEGQIPPVDDSFQFSNFVSIDSVGKIRDALPNHFATRVCNHESHEPTRDWVHVREAHYRAT